MYKNRFKILGIIMAYAGILLGITSSSLISNSGFNYGMASMLFSLFIVALTSKKPQTSLNIE